MFLGLDLSKRALLVVLEWNYRRMALLWHIF